MASLLTGAPVAEALNDRTRADVSLLEKRGITPTLAIVRLGENDADIYYERGAMKRCEAVGVSVKNVIFSESVEESVLIETIKQLNNDTSVHGVLIFRPLPKNINDKLVCQTLAPEKDVDGITDGSMAGVFTGSGRGYCPCTAQACVEVLDYYGVDCKGKRAVILGRSLVIGKPVALLLLDKHATVTMCHTRTLNLVSETRRADIIVAAAGHAGAITSEHVSDGQIIVDVGINTGADGKMCGDVAFSEVEPLVGAITPVPGGVGAVTTSVLVRHVVTAAMKSSGINSVE